MMNIIVPDNEIFDITFIGAGPVALYGMYYSGLRRTRSKVVDMLGEVGGGLMALYPEKYIFDVAGFPKILAKDLIKNLKQQADQYEHTYCLEQKVEGLERTSNGLLKLSTPKGEHLSKSVIICMGMGAYIPKKIDVPNVEKLEGAGVFYFVREPEQFRDKEILIVGGGDAAFDYAMMLEPIAKKITHIHRNSFFSAHEDSVEKVKNSTVNMKFPFWEVKEITGEEWVETATIVQSQTGETEKLKVDAIIFNIGFITNVGPLEQWGLQLDNNSIFVDSRMRTNIDGVFAAGDIVNYDGKLKLISTGCGEVAVAVNNAKSMIDPKAKVNPGHSTDKHEMVLRKIAREKRKKQQMEEE